MKKTNKYIQIILKSAETSPEIQVNYSNFCSDYAPGSSSSSSTTSTSRNSSSSSGSGIGSIVVEVKVAVAVAVEVSRF